MRLPCSPGRSRWTGGAGSFTIAVMNLRRHGTFSGGIDLPDPCPDVWAARIETCAPLARLLVPCYPSARPAVTVGQRVGAGQRIAAAEGPRGLDVFAPLDGTVSSIGRADLVDGRRMLTVAAVELTDLSAPPGPAAPAESFDWRDADPHDLRDRLADGALATMGPVVEPVEAWLARAARGPCEIIIANVTANEPYLSADHRLLVEFGREVVFGLEILRRAAGVARAAVAVDHRRTGDYRACGEAAREMDIDRVSLTHKYPIGDGRLLTRVLTGRRTPVGGRTTEVGVALVDASTCMAAWRWVACGARPTHRVVALAGAGRARNVWAPLGAPSGDLAGGAGELICGGAMTGRACDAAVVVTPGTRALIRLDTAALGPPRACVRCAWCLESCPARLDVAALNEAFELGRFDGPAPRAAGACIGCGICSYVCPSCLPLTARVRRLKRAGLAVAGTEGRP